MCCVCEVEGGGGWGKEKGSEREGGEQKGAREKRVSERGTERDRHGQRAI